MSEKVSELLIRGTNIPVDWEEVNGVKHHVSMPRWTDALSLAWRKGNRTEYYPNDKKIVVGGRIIE